MLGDDYFMGLALSEAKMAADEGEIPIGAVVVGDGRILGRGHNRTESLGDVTAHAEMLALSAAALTLGGKYLSGCTLYVTVEPCPMCAGAIGWAQIGRIVIGAPDPKRGYSTILRQGASPFHPRATVVEGIREGECRALMQDFFRKKRMSK
ncbi:MAG: nucleoside deaminase [Muribaculaceae bacterium]|nr:nucleoside deaminase [Muribaculaceae bacterium]